MDFRTTYEKVKWIVWKCKKDYYIHLWEHSDWEQEGMLVLYELLLKEKGIENDEKNSIVISKQNSEIIYMIKFVNKKAKSVNWTASLMKK